MKASLFTQWSQRQDKLWHADRELPKRGCSPSSHIWRRRLGTLRAMRPLSPPRTHRRPGGPWQTTVALLAGGSLWKRKRNKMNRDQGTGGGLAAKGRGRRYSPWSLCSPWDLEGPGKCKKKSQRWGGCVSLWGTCTFTLENSLSWYLRVSLEDQGARWDQQGLESPRREAAALEGFSQPSQCPVCMAATVPHAEDAEIRGKSLSSPLSV